MEIQYTLKFQEGWRIGSGEAAGHELDQQIRRDAQKLPFVPGTTLRGLVRDAVEQLAQVLHIELCEGSVERQNGQPSWLCGVTSPPEQAGICPRCALLGSTHTEAQVSWGPARLVLNAPEDTRKYLASAAVAIPGLLTRAHARTAIEHHSGRAEDQKLFSIEEAQADLELCGSLEIDPDVSPRNLALLVAALRWIKEMGGGRRRGSGACRLQIDRADFSTVFESWEAAVESLKKLPLDSRQSDSTRELKPTRSTKPLLIQKKILQLTATVVGEVTLGGRPDTGNLISGLAHIPGSTVRGALAALWQGDYESTAFRTCFLEEKIRYGFLYPISTQETMRPLASSWQTCKQHPGKVDEDFGHGLFDMLTSRKERCCRCNSRLVPWGPRFVATGVSEAPQLVLSPHNRIDSALQTVGAGALFAYEALPEGTRLRGFLRAAESKILERLLNHLDFQEVGPSGWEFRLRVGRRKGALGYLDCRLEEFRGEEFGVGLFPDSPRLPQPRDTPAAVRVDLLTPAILTDSELRYQESLTPSDCGIQDSHKSFDRAFARTTLISGWNSAHRLPKADELAVAAGSSYLLKNPSSADLEALQRAAQEGVGRRRQEGFGVLTYSEVSMPSSEAGKESQT